MGLGLHQVMLGAFLVVRHCLVRWRSVSTASYCLNDVDQFLLGWGHWIWLYFLHHQIALLQIGAKSYSLLQSLRVVVKSLVEGAFVLSLNFLDWGIFVHVDVRLDYRVNLSFYLLDALSIEDYRKPLTDSLLVLGKYILIVSNTFHAFQLRAFCVFLRFMHWKMVSYCLVHLLLYLPGCGVRRPVDLSLRDTESILNTLGNGSKSLRVISVLKILF